jgi:RHS repeat-associated protein
VCNHLILLPILGIANRATASAVFSYGVESEETIYLRARHYDPEVGAFISKDPIGMQGGLNCYQYALNDPINKTDPSGNISILVVMAIAGVGGGIVSYISARAMDGSETDARIAAAAGFVTGFSLGSINAAGGTVTFFPNY